MRGFTRQIQPVVSLVPGYDVDTGLWKPTTVNMNASVKNISTETGNESFLRLLVTFAASMPTPAFIFLEPFYKSGITDFSIQAVNDDGAISAVASSLANKNDILDDFSNVGHLSWNTESLISGGTNRWLVHGPVTALKITGTGACYVLGN